MKTPSTIPLQEPSCHSGHPPASETGSIDQPMLFFRERITNSQRTESIGILAGGVAHDFNNYLTGILNSVNLAKLCTVSRQIEQYLNNTIAIINDAQKLTKQFLRYSKNSEPSRTMVRIDKIIRDNILILLSGTNIRAELHVDDDLWQCEIDENQIAQVFGSIIINAREAMPDGGIIDITLRNEDIQSPEIVPLSAGKYVRVQIKDTGCGIPSEIQKCIFSPYFTTKFNRSGLGLTSAMIIAKNHNGHIAISSEVNAGSVFTIYLPSVDTSKNGASMREEQKNGGKVLLMDDEHYIRQTASEILKKKNFNVVTATQGLETIELFKNAHSSDAPFDVVILDLTIPDGMGGLETLKKLLEIDPEVKAIASSGYSDDPVISQPEKYGFADSLGKPYNLNEFINVIKNLISRAI
jgi:CheY-like chemotaxis protein